jgi:hypothetical protein
MQLVGETVMSDKQAVSSRHLIKRLGIVGLALWGIAMPTASFALGTDAERAACTPDVFRLCASEIPNVDRIIACMIAKKASLSAPCKQVFDRRFAGQSAQGSQ